MAYSRALVYLLYFFTSSFGFLLDLYCFCFCSFCQLLLDLSAAPYKFGFSAYMIMNFFAIFFSFLSSKAISYTVGFRQSKTALFDWILLVLLLIDSRVDFTVFVLFLEAVGVREYCCTAGEIGWQLCASRCLREQRLDEPSSQRVGGFGLSRKPPMLRSWSCTQPRAAKAAAGAVVVGSMGSIPRAAAVV